MKKLYHVVWSVFGLYPLWDERGRWEEFHKIYDSLIQNNTHLKFDKSLPISSFTRYNETIDSIQFSQEDIEFLTNEIKVLTKVNGDRICGELDLIHLNVRETFIELVVKEEQEHLKNKLARLKSRLATLLRFEDESRFKGKNTWGKGIWVVEILDNYEYAIETIKATRKKV